MGLNLTHQTCSSTKPSKYKQQVGTRDACSFNSSHLHNAVKICLLLDMLFILFNMLLFEPRTVSIERWVSAPDMNDPLNHVWGYFTNRLTYKSYKSSYLYRIGLFSSLSFCVGNVTIFKMSFQMRRENSQKNIWPQVRTKVMFGRAEIIWLFTIESVKLWTFSLCFSLTDLPIIERVLMFGGIALAVLMFLLATVSVAGIIHRHGYLREVGTP